MLGCAAVGLGGVGGSEVLLDIAAGDVGMGLTWGMAMVVEMGQDSWEQVCSLHLVGCGLLTW